MTAQSLVARAKRVAFQGEPGAYANLAAREALPHAMAIPRPTFEDAIAAVREGEADLAIIPVENSLHGISPIRTGDMNDPGYLGGGNSTAQDNFTVSGAEVGSDVLQIWHSGTSGHPGARA